MWFDVIISFRRKKKSKVTITVVVRSTKPSKVSKKNGVGMTN